ncbi:hypothetical protein H0H87_009333 [Tephrocybe sp. NHM501043]|nr:hypothetical protein H0H87_009333 [Tephrocybe sp. NHM501043]
MGKWTPDYIDDVLHSKIKNLVSGAITRSTLEETEPTIGYEEFVHDLETGDSFTTSLIEVLVKELAERRTRPHANGDRRLIAERTARNLRQLGAPHRIYHEEHSHGRYIPRRRSANLSDYLSAPPPEMDMEEDEDIFGRFLGNDPNIIEGARINSDLYDAYGGGHSRAISSPSPPAEEVTSPLPPPLPHTNFRSGPWSMLSGSSSLNRQPSLRRSTRSARTVDFNEFNEFTHRRRSSTRENISRGELSESHEHWEPLRHSQSTRRFFPITRARRYDPQDSWNPDVPSSHEHEDAIYPGEPSNVPWFNPTPPVHRDPLTMEEVLAESELSEERAQGGPMPRLRRGGLRAPESIISRHSSPMPFSNSHEPRRLAPTREEAQSPAAPSGYPTPGSTEHEFIA